MILLTETLQQVEEKQFAMEDRGNSRLVFGNAPDNNGG